MVLSPTTVKLPSVVLGKLTKQGKTQDSILSKVNSRLKLLLQLDNPIQKSIDTIRPVLYYKRSSKSASDSHPIMLSEKKSFNLGWHWIVHAAMERKYIAGRKTDLEQGLYDEILAIFQGTSSLYTRRFRFHRAP